MSNEVKNATAIELSEQELDIVAGGNGESLNFGINGSSFEQTALVADEATFAGPQGAGTTKFVQLQGLSSNALQGGIVTGK